jgi:hypothetical protein
MQTEVYEKLRRHFHKHPLGFPATEEQVEIKILKWIFNEEEHVCKGIMILDGLGMKPWISMGYFALGELHSNSGQKDKALENLKQAEEMFQEMGMDYWLARTRKVLETMR